MKPRDLIGLHAAVLLFGLAALLGRVVDASPAVITLARCLTGALALLPFWLRAVRRRDTPRHASPSTISGLLLPGLLLAGHWVSFFDAVQQGGVALALLAYASFPLVSLLLDLLQGDRSVLYGRNAAAMLLSLAGVIVLMATVSGAPGPDPLRGLASGLLSGLLFALLSFVNGRWLRSRGALELSFRQLSIASLLLLPVAGRELLEVAIADWAALLALGLLCTALGHALFIHALGRTSLTHAARVAALEPLYGIVLALLLLAEWPASGQWAALPLLLAGALLEERKQGQTRVNGNGPGSAC